MNVPSKETATGGLRVYTLAIDCFKCVNPGFSFAPKPNKHQKTSFTGARRTKGEVDEVECELEALVASQPRFSRETLVHGERIIFGESLVSLEKENYEVIWKTN